MSRSLVYKLHKRYSDDRDSAVWAACDTDGQSQVTLRDSDHIRTILELCDFTEL